MAKAKVLSFKQGDDFKLDFTLTDTNHTGAISAAETLATAQQDLADLKAADPQDPVAIAAAETDVSNAQDAYDAAIVLDITGWGVDSQLRWCGKLIDTFDVDLSQAAIGKFTISRASTDTALWKPRKYDMDIQFTRVTGKISSETFILDVEKDVTSV
jgi:hypothetical protein